MNGYNLMSIFAKYENVWCHSDWVMLTQEKGMIFYGRSDATLNPGGVRIGTSEIYRQVETIDEVLESVVERSRYAARSLNSEEIKIIPLRAIALARLLEEYLHEQCTA